MSSGGGSTPAPPEESEANKALTEQATIFQEIANDRIGGGFSRYKSLATADHTDRLLNRSAVDALMLNAQKEIGGNNPLRNALGGLPAASAGANSARLAREGGADRIMAGHMGLLDATNKQAVNVIPSLGKMASDQQATSLTALSNKMNTKMNAQNTLLKTIGSGLDSWDTYEARKLGLGEGP